MYIQLSGGTVINANAIVHVSKKPMLSIESTHCEYNIGTVDNYRYRITEEEHNNLLKIFSLQGNLLSMAEVAQHSDGLNNLINYRDTKHKAGHQLIKMMQEDSATIKAIEDAEKLEEQLKTMQQSFDFPDTSKVN